MIHMILEWFVSSARIWALTSVTPGACAVTGSAANTKQERKNALNLATFPPSGLLLAHHQYGERTFDHRTARRAPCRSGGSVGRRRTEFGRHGEQVICLGVERQRLRASHRRKRLLYREARGTIFLDERHRAGIFRTDGFHRGGIERHLIHAHAGRK